MKNIAFLLATALGLTFGQAAHIAVNFSENNGNQEWLSTSDIVGPLNTLTANFNSTNNPTGGPANTQTGSLATGTLSDLVDDSGAVVSSQVSWSSANAWWNASGTADSQARLAVGYLDDGGAGASISVTEIPYASYDVYVLLGSDAGDTHDSESPLVNGSPILPTDFPAFGNLLGSGGVWVEADGTERGNYVVQRGVSGADLTITGQNNSGNRIGIAGSSSRTPPPMTPMTTACPTRGRSPICSIPMMTERAIRSTGRTETRMAMV